MPPARQRNQLPGFFLCYRHGLDKVILLNLVKSNSQWCRLWRLPLRLFSCQPSLRRRAGNKRCNRFAGSA